MKQDDDLLHNYTVAKITEDMDFSVNSRAYDLVLGCYTKGLLSGLLTIAVKYIYVYMAAFERPRITV